MLYGIILTLAIVALLVFAIVKGSPVESEESSPSFEDGVRREWWHAN